MKTLVWTCLLAVAPAAAAGQGLARRVSELEDGTLQFSYPARPDVEICEQGIRMGEHKIWWRSRGWDEEATNCRTGSVEVEVAVRGSSVRDVEVVRRPGDRTPGAEELGEVPAAEAAAFFLEVARAGGPSGRGVEDAVFPAVLADVEEVWRGLMELARDRGADQDVRTSALFWVGQDAAATVTEGLAGVALDEAEDQDVRDAAVFALSQRPPDEAIPILMEIARTASQGETRRSAMFWLAQSRDERVYAFFEEILTGRSGG